MACVEHYIKDAENIFDEIQERERIAQENSFREYVATRTIQRWFRGYITRKYIKHLHECATTIQKHWRGYKDRNYYYCLLQDAVHEMYMNHYNLMATKIQKVWRGHYVRSRVFSYYKLKQYIRECQEKNIQALEKAMAYKEELEMKMQQQMQEECQKWLDYISFKTHHLLRTRQIEGVYSKHQTLDYSEIEKHLKSIKFKEYMDYKHEKKKNVIQDTEEKQDYLFKGRMQQCEKMWRHRNDPGKVSLATGEYGLDQRLHEERVKINNTLRCIQDKPMCFGKIHYEDETARLNYKKYECPPLHQTVK